MFRLFLGFLLIGSPQFRDVAILAPTNEMLDAAAFALAQAGVPHVVAGRGFYASTEVRDLRSMLALVIDPKDKLAMLEVLVRRTILAAGSAT